LDTTEISKWDEEVKNKAINIIESHINSVPCAYEPLKPTIEEEKKAIDGNSRNYCTVCNRLILGDKTYAIHLQSFRHMKVLKKQKKLAEKTKETLKNT
jgi:tRNA dimethylallyltransferase